MSKYMHFKKMFKRKNFKNMKSLEPVKKVLIEASEAMNDPNRTIDKSSIPDILGAAIGAGVGSAISFSVLYSLGTVGLGLTGISSGLDAAGTKLGKGKATGAAVLATPIVLLSVAGYGVSKGLSIMKLKETKENLLQESMAREDAIKQELNNGSELQEERVKYLEGLNILINSAIKELREDLGYWSDVELPANELPANELT